MLAWNIVIGQPGFMLPDITSFEVNREIVNYFSYFKATKKETNIAEKSKTKISCGVPHKYSKITSEIGVPWLCWKNQIHNSPFGLDINEWLLN